MRGSLRKSADDRWVDRADRELVDQVRPSDWTNPVPSGRYNLVVIGGGTAGLVSAMGAAGLGARVALVEAHALGGDCLNSGCVPSKGLIEAARSVHAARRADGSGVDRTDRAQADFSAAMARMRRLRAEIASNDSAARLAAHGVDVYFGQGRFVASDAIEVAGQRLQFARAVIATGSRPTIPPVAGLDEVGYLTNETIFALTELPRRLVVIGAGPIGCELAQAFRRFGSEVTIVDRSEQVLPREDADVAELVAERLRAEGIELFLGASVAGAELLGGGKRIAFCQGDSSGEVIGDEILLAVGRTPNVETLELSAANVDADEDGIVVNDRLRTRNRRIYAAGDVCSRYKFTHAADAMARIVLRNALFFGRRRASKLIVPWCTYTDPEVAHVGIHLEEAQARDGAVETVTVPLADNDRARLDGSTQGVARVHIGRRGRILGATMVAPHAGEMIGEMTLAMASGTTIGDLAETIHPYPTVSEAWKHTGDRWQRSRLTPALRRLFELFLGWRR